MNIHLKQPLKISSSDSNQLLGICSVHRRPKATLPNQGLHGSYPLVPMGEDPCPTPYLKQVYCFSGGHSWPASVQPLKKVETWFCLPLTPDHLFLKAGSQSFAVPHAVILYPGGVRLADRTHLTHSSTQLTNSPTDAPIRHFSTLLELDSTLRTQIMCKKFTQVTCFWGPWLLKLGHPWSNL